MASIKMLLGVAAARVAFPAWSASAAASSSRCRASSLSTLFLCASRASDGVGFMLRHWLLHAGACSRSGW
jgi:hypothetical protein